MTRLFFASAAAISMASAACAQPAAVEPPPNVPEFSPAFEGQTRAPRVESGVEFEAETLAAPLEHPWAIALTPDGAILVTERPGRLRVIRDGVLSPEPVAGLPEVVAEKQGGLLDVTVGPDFSTDRMIYWTYSKPLPGGLSATAAARGKLSEDMTEVTGVEDILVQDPPAPEPMHYGSRILFDGEGLAHVTLGERSTEKNRVLAQDLGSSYGKVVRVTAEGEVPQDNPFVDREGALPTILSYGHRNIQGAAFRPGTGELWTIEHGPKGGDELNLIEPGANYGWPVISYGINYNGSPVGEKVTAAEGMEQPAYYWDPVIAPGGMVFYEGGMYPDWEGDLIVASLAPGAVVRLEMEGDRVVGEERMLSDQGRIRDVAIAPDGAILAITDATGGALLRLTPKTAEG